MTLVLVNPHAKGGRVRHMLPAVRRVLDELAPLPRLHAPDTVQDALDLLMREPEGSRVVLVGGDGSVNRWLPALLTRQLHTGLVPLGSGNDLARALGLDRQHWPSALALALQGNTRPMDTGLAVWTDMHGDSHRTPFTSSLTAGFDSSVALRALQGPRWLSGLPRYLWATLRELQHLRHWTVRAQADGQHLDDGPVLLMSVLNTPTLGAGIAAMPHASTHDGQLDWLRAGPFGRLSCMHLLPRFMFGRHLTQPGVQAARFEQLNLHCPEGIPLAADGEWLGLARQVHVRVQAHSLHMVTGNV